MSAPRKKNGKRKTGRPLEHVPLRKLIRQTKREIHEAIRLSMSDKPKPD